MKWWMRPFRRWRRPWSPDWMTPELKVAARIELLAGKVSLPHRNWTSTAAAFEEISSALLDLAEEVRQLDPNWDPDGMATEPSA